MASAPPAGSVQSLPPPHNDISAPLTPLSWEGEKMFNIYIYDYCFKRGFRKTARELLQEADIPADSTPPINARQGLLFEWWSVFWVLFQAKSNGGGSEEAQLYTQHQQQQQQRTATRVQGPMPSASMSGQAPQQPLQRQGTMPAGMMNGMTANIPGQPQLPPGAAQMGFAMGGGPGPQMNGIPGPHPPTPGSAPAQLQHSQAPHQGGPQQPNFNPMRPAQMNGPHPQQQHPPNAGPQQQQQRPMGAPFQSPTMAPSPNMGGPGGMQQQHGPHPSQGQQHPGGQQQAPMGNIGGPSPLLGHMNRGGAMLPPNGTPQGMVMGGVPQQPQQGGPMQPTGTPTQAFSTIGGTGRPPSRTNTPQMQVNMMHQSPSMANRQLMTPGAEIAISNDFMRMPPPLIQSLKHEIGMGDKDNASLTTLDKRRLLEANARRAGRQGNAIAGPSNPMMPPHQQQPQQQQRGPQQAGQSQRGGKRNSTSPGEEHENLPGNESSPPDRKRPRRSPMENSMPPKNLTSMSYPQTPLQGSIPPPPPPQGGQPQGQPPQGQPPGGTQQQPPPTGMGQNMVMMGGRPMGPQGGPMQQQMGMGVNGHGHGVPPPGMGMQGQPPPPGQMQMQGGMNPNQPMGPPHMGLMMQGQMGQNYRVPLHQVHNAAGMMQASVGSPSGPDPSSFNPGGPNSGPPPPGGPPGGPQFNNNRMVGNKPPQAGGMPMPPGAPGGPPGNMMPPSPANGGKDGQGKDGKLNPSGSPRGVGQPPNHQGGPSQQQQQQNNAGGPPQGQPGTPAPQSQQQQQQGGNQSGGGGPPPQSSVGGSGPGLSTSPNGMLGGGGPGGMGGLGGLNEMNDPTMLFSTDFAMTDFDAEMFGRPDAGNLDFERDFGQWFHPDEMGPLDMK